MAKLKPVLLLRLRKVHFLQQTVSLVSNDHQWGRIRGEGERLLRMFNPYLVQHLRPRRGHFDPEREAEDSCETVHRLLLPDFEMEQAGIVIPFLRHFQDGESCLIQPLIEEPVEILSRSILQRELQLVRLGARIGIPREIGMKPPVECLIPKQVAKHEEHPRPAFVEVCAFVAAAHDRVASVLPVVPPDPERRCDPLILLLILSLRCLRVEPFEVRGESFIQPEMPPVAACDEIAPPLVRQLVGDDSPAWKIRRAPAVDDGSIVQRHRCGVLHPPPHELIDNDLRELFPWIGNSRLAFKKTYHGGRVPERGLHVHAVLRIHIIEKRDVPVHIPCNRVPAGGNHDEVRRMGLPFFPVKCPGLPDRIMSFCDQPAVGEECVLLSHGRNDF